MLTKSFHRLWLSQALSTLGDIWYILALVTTLYRLSGSAFITALYPLLKVAGMMIGSTFAPVLIAKLRLTRLLTLCLGGQMIGISLLAAYMFISGRAHLNVVLLVSFVFVISILEGVASPVRSSLVPVIVPKASLLKANGVLTSVVETCSLAGWAFGSIMVSWLGADEVLILSAFLLCGAWGASSRIRENSTGLAEVQASVPWFSSIQAGWQHYFRIPRLRLLLWMNIWEGLLGAAFAGALLLVFVHERLHAGELWWGWMNGAYLGGFAMVSLLISRLSGRLQNLNKMLISGSGGYALLTLGLGFTSSPFAALGVMFILGASLSVKDLAERTLYQTSVPAAELPPLLSAHSTLRSSTEHPYYCPGGLQI